MAEPLILALDQGTTSTRSVVFDRHLAPLATAQLPLAQHFPQPGWVEHDGEEIWRAALQTAREAADAAGGPARIAAIGLTNQRETVVLWERDGGRPLHRALVWQDRRTAPLTDRLRGKGHEAEVQSLTGLVLDPYFSASKIAWLLDAVPGARARAEAGELCAGTIDSWLIHRLTGGQVFATDVTNAARTSLFDIHRLAWDPALLDLFGIPSALLAEVRPCTGPFGQTDPSLFGRPIPITGVAGDQQAALVGHGALAEGEAKITFGTGGFLVVNTGGSVRASANRLLATVAYQTGGPATYAIEGSIFSAGSTIQWLRDGLGLIEASRDSEALAAALPDSGGVYLVPAFTGLGAPWWAAEARGAVFGLTRDTGRAHLVRAGLEAMAYQTLDLIEAMVADGAPRPLRLKVDGGVTANALAMQTLADICSVEVERPAYQEMTALGAARLAALGAGLAPDLAGEAPAAPALFRPDMPAALRDRRIAGWRAARDACLAHGRAGL